MDVSEHREGLAWFYFAGHGLELTSTEQAMVLADFGSGDRPASPSRAHREQSLLRHGPIRENAGRRAALG